MRGMFANGWAFARISCIIAASARFSCDCLLSMSTTRAALPSIYRVSKAKTGLVEFLESSINLAGATDACSPAAGLSSVTETRVEAPPGAHAFFRSSNLISTFSGADIIIPFGR